MYSSIRDVNNKLFYLDVAPVDGLRELEVLAEALLFEVAHRELVRER